MSKHVRSSYPAQEYKASHPSIIHSDVCRPYKVKTVTGAKWFVTFIDDHLRLTWVFLKKEKSAVKSFHDMVQTQFNTKIQIPHTDNAKDDFNSILGEYLTKKRIVHKSSCIDPLNKMGLSKERTDIC